MTNASTTIKLTKEIDARGSFCPGPLMELIRQLRAAQVGDVISVLSSDPGSITDIPLWAAKAKQEFIATEDIGDGVKRLIIRKTR